jgi:hypothetical protein
MLSIAGSDRGRKMLVRRRRDDYDDGARKSRGSGGIGRDPSERVWGCFWGSWFGRGEGLGEMGRGIKGRGGLWMVC